MAIQVTGPTLANPVFGLSGDVGEQSGVTLAAGTGPVSGQSQPVVVRDSEGRLQEIGYVLNVNIPIPGLDFNVKLDLLGDFVLPALTALGVPAASLWTAANLLERVQKLLDDAALLIQVIPEATVAIVIQLAGLPVVSINLTARKQYVDIGPPVFSLGLPNFSFTPDYKLKLPTIAPVNVAVPIPVPRIRLDASVYGTDALVEVNARVTAEAEPVTNPVYFPRR